MRRELTAATVVLLCAAAHVRAFAIDMPAISEAARAGLDRALAAKGTYVSEESAYKFAFPRMDLSVRVGSQRLSALQAPPSWLTFSPAKGREAFINAEFVVVEDEVNAVVAAALKAGLAVTGLGPALLSQPLLLAVNVNGDGTYQSLGTAARRVLDEIRRIRNTKRIGPLASGSVAAPSRDAIDPAPLNSVLSMRGAAVDGIYRAAIGRVEIVGATPLGREMGMSSRLTIFGTNDKAFLDAEFIVNGDELQRVLGAVTAQNLNLAGIRNHLVGEHPQAIFVRVWRRGPALDLARAVRCVLDVEVGAVRSGN